jgi:hypothetical protein
LDNNHESKGFTKNGQVQAGPPTALAEIREETGFTGRADYLDLPAWAQTVVATGNYSSRF